VLKNSCKEIYTSRSHKSVTSSIAGKNNEHRLSVNPIKKSSDKLSCNSQTFSRQKLPLKSFRSLTLRRQRTSRWWPVTASSFTTTTPPCLRTSSTSRPRGPCHLPSSKTWDQSYKTLSCRNFCFKRYFTKLFKQPWVF